jgi:putative transposase
MLGVSVSGYSAWRARPESEHARKDGDLTQAIESASATSRQSYGSPRILVEL